MVAGMGRSRKATWLVLWVLIALGSAVHAGRYEGLENTRGPTESGGGGEWEAKAARIAESIGLPERFFETFKQAAKSVRELCIGTPKYSRPSKVGDPEGFDQRFRV
jgi:hypothetical protein